MQTRTSVVGLGKLGACMAAAFASRGLPTIGVDIRRESIDDINAGRAPVDEPGLGELIASAGSNLRATDDMSEAVHDSDITFIVVPTPSNPDGAFSLHYATAAARSIGGALKDKDAYHVVVMTSTVLPGCTDAVLKAALEEASGKRCGTDFGLCYSPEFIALGSVIRDFLNPDFLLIGEDDVRAGDFLEQTYASLFDAAPAAHARMTIVNAELTKIALNSYVTTKITFANLLAELCEQLPGGDVDAVTQALGLDSRIGRKYLRGALGFGGPCFPRDNIAFSHLIESLGIPATLPRSVHDFNQRQATRVAARAKASLGADQRRVGVLGLAYKPDTNVVEESQGVAIAAELAAAGLDVIAWDPKACANAKVILGDRVSWATTGQQCIDDVDLVIVATPWPEFADYDYSAGKPPRVIDPWRIVAKRPTQWTALGVGDDDDATRERIQGFARAIADGDPRS